MTKRDLRKAARLLKDAARGLYVDNTLVDGSWFGETQAHADAYRKEYDELVRVSRALYAEARPARKGTPLHATPLYAVSNIDFIEQDLKTFRETLAR